MTPNYVTITIAKFHTKKSKILQILQLAICQWSRLFITEPINYIHEVKYG
jgi:hypothetical protein